MKTSARPTKKPQFSSNDMRDKRIKKVGKAAHHKPKYRHAIFNTNDE